MEAKLRLRRSRWSLGAQHIATHRIFSRAHTRCCTKSNRLGGHWFAATTASECRSLESAAAPKLTVLRGTFRLANIALIVRDFYRFSLDRLLHKALKLASECRSLESAAAPKLTVLRGTFRLANIALIVRDFAPDVHLDSRCTKQQLGPLNKSITT